MRLQVVSVVFSVVLFAASAVNAQDYLRSSAQPTSFSSASAALHVPNYTYSNPYGYWYSPGYGYSGYGGYPVYSYPIFYYGYYGYAPFHTYYAPYYGFYSYWYPYYGYSNWYPYYGYSYYYGYPVGYRAYYYLGAAEIPANLTVDNIVLAAVDKPAAPEQLVSLSNAAGSAPKQSEMSPDAAFFFNSACEQYWDGEYAGALKDLATVLPFAETDPRVWYYKGLCEIQLEDEESALNSLGQAIRLHVQYPAMNDKVNQALERLQGPLRNRLVQARYAYERKSKTPQGENGRSRVAQLP